MNHILNLTMNHLPHFYNLTTDGKRKLSEVLSSEEPDFLALIELAEFGMEGIDFDKVILDDTHPKYNDFQLVLKGIKKVIPLSDAENIEKMEKARIELCLSKSNFAERLGVSHITYSRWVNGVCPVTKSALILAEEFLKNEKIEDFKEAAQQILSQ